MSTDIEVQDRPTGALAVSSGQTEWTSAQLAALAQAGVANAPRGDQLVLLHQSQRTGLDPFAKQIYMIGRNSKDRVQVAPGQWEDRWVTKWTIQTGIDGYRVIARRIADRRRETLAYEDTLWCGPDGRWVDVWLKQEPPAAAKVTVLRNGARFSAVARFSAYAQTKSNGGLTSMWARMPDVMIQKCAEALALRKAYPQDLAGIYTSEEMGQADNLPPVDITATTVVQSPAGEQPDPNVLVTPPDAELVAELADAIDGADLDGLRDLWRNVDGLLKEGKLTESGRDHLCREILARQRVLGPASKQTLTRMHTLLTRRGVTDQDERLLVAIRITGRDDIESTAALTGGEAEQVIRAVEESGNDVDLLTGEQIPEGAGVDPAEYAQGGSGQEPAAENEHAA